MNKYFTTIIILVILGLNLSAQEMVTDRPDQTESSSTIPKNSIQIEMGVLLGNDNEGSSRQLLAPTTLIRYGLTKGIELRLGENIEFNNTKNNPEYVFGVSDLELGAKFQLLKNENINTEIAFLTHLIVPVGSNNLTIGQLGVVNIVAFSHQLNAFMELGYNLGYNYFGAGNGDFTYSSALGISITDKIGTYIEIYGELLEINNFVANFDSGITYLIKPNFQLDLSFGLGLNQKTNYVALGFSWNFNL
ncbi:MAG TPA: transporter [Prolixibacteraceae bacterium]|nr:transporter [Prolixibacteraceae bacterium]